MYLELQEIYEDQQKLENKLDKLNNKDFWVSEAISYGLRSDFDSAKVYVSLEKFGPVVTVYIEKKTQMSSYIYDKLIGSAKYITYNSNWEINNYKD